MEFTGTWFSKLGFYLELKDTSPVISGNFYLPSKKFTFKGIALEIKDHVDVSFIVNWDIKALTAFSGSLISKDLLHMSWLLTIENKNSSKIEQFKGDLFLTHSAPANSSFPHTQFVLPYPKILLPDTVSLSCDNAK